MAFMQCAAKGGHVTLLLSFARLERLFLGIFERFGTREK
jgi:hypothetical protein